jgi:hypothetical protein
MNDNNNNSSPNEGEGLYLTVESILPTNVMNFAKSTGRQIVIHSLFRFLLEDFPGSEKNISRSEPFVDIIVS